MRIPGRCPPKEKEEEVAPPPPTRDQELLAEIRNLLREKRAEPR